MSTAVRYYVLVKFKDQDALIDSIEKLEKAFTSADYASPGMAKSPGHDYGIKLLTYQRLGNQSAFMKFATKVLKINSVLKNADMVPGYVSESQVVSAFTAGADNRVYFSEKMYLALQLFFTKNTYQFHLLTDDEFRAKTAVTFFNDTRRLLINHLKKN